MVAILPMTLPADLVSPALRHFRMTAARGQPFPDRTAPAPPQEVVRRRSRPPCGSPRHTELIDGSARLHDVHAALMARSTRPEFALRDQTVKRRKYAEPGSRIRPDRNPPRQAENIRAIWDGTALRRQSATSDQKFLDCSDDGRIGTIHIEKCGQSLKIVLPRRPPTSARPPVQTTIATSSSEGRDSRSPNDSGTSTSARSDRMACGQEAFSSRQVKASTSATPLQARILPRRRAASSSRSTRCSTSYMMPCRQH